MLTAKWVVEMSALEKSGNGQLKIQLTSATYNIQHTTIKQDYFIHSKVNVTHFLCETTDETLEHFPLNCIV